MGGTENFDVEGGVREEQTGDWRKGVEQKREALFRRHWKNRRHIPGLVSLGAARDFEFIIEWCDESGDVLNRDQERRRLDKLIAIGVDVNLPREQQPIV